MNPTPPPGQPPPASNLYSLELSRNLRVDSVSRLHPTAPHSIDAEKPVSAAVEAMRHGRVGCLLVTRDGKLVGIFTERDLLVRVLGPRRPLTTPLADCMTAKPMTVAMKDSIQTAVSRMESGGYRHLPVMDEQDRPVGILSARRVLHYLVEHFPALVYNQPPVLNQVPELPDGA